MINQFQASSGAAEKMPSERQDRVFVSYSRSDLSFAEVLVELLCNAKIDAYLDKKDILPGEPWKERLTALITKADAVVFVITPHSVLHTSMCDWELNEAERMGKRVIPILHRETPVDLVPSRLKRLNWINMMGHSPEQWPLNALITSLRTDHSWLRAHTHFTELVARSRIEGGWKNGSLLRGDDIAEAERWLSATPAPSPDVPIVTEDQRAFIQSSRSASNRSARARQIIAWGVTFLTITIAAIAVFQRNAAITSERTATDQREKAIANEARAIAANEDATRERNQKIEANTQLQLEIANLALTRNNGATAALLALEAWDGAQHQNVSIKNRAALHRMLELARRANREYAITIGCQVRKSADEVEPDASGEQKSEVSLIDKPLRLISRDGSVIRICNLESPARSLFRHPQGVKFVDFCINNATRTMVTLDAEKKFHEWPLREGPSPARGRLIAAKAKDSEYSDVSCIGGSHIASRIERGDASATEIIDQRTGRKIFTIESKNDASYLVATNASGSRGVVVGYEGGAAIWDMRAFRPIRTLAEELGWIGRAIMSPVGSKFITMATGLDGVQLYHGETGTHIADLIGHPSTTINGAAFSPDGKHLIVYDELGVAVTWSLTSNTKIATFKRHRASINSIRFCQDAGTVVSASTDGTARVWDYQSGAEVIALEHGAALIDADFHENCRKIAAVLEGGVAWHWDLHDKFEPIVVRAPSVPFTHATVDSTRPYSFGTIDVSSERIVLARRNGEVSEIDLNNWIMRKTSRSPEANEARGSPAPQMETAVRGLWTRRSQNDDLLSVIERDESASGDVGWPPIAERVVMGPDLGIAAAWRGRMLQFWAVDGKYKVVEIDIGALGASDGAKLSWSEDGRFVVVLDGGGERGQSKSSDFSNAWIVPAPMALEMAVHGTKQKLLRCFTTEQRAKFGLSASNPNWCEQLHKWTGSE